MCLSIPLQLVALEDENGDFAIAERRQGSALRRERVNMMLIGPQPARHLDPGLARPGQEVLDDHERALIEDALAALGASLAGDYDPSSAFFRSDHACDQARRTLQ
jgi:hydrogenase expression/formation protein HypC